jgi:hypothetical protein
MRRGLGLLRAAERRREVDRLMLEGRQQQYGTQLEWTTTLCSIRSRLQTRRTSTCAGEQ